MATFDERIAALQWKAGELMKMGAENAKLADDILKGIADLRSQAIEVQQKTAELRQAYLAETRHLEADLEKKLSELEAAAAAVPLPSLPQV